MNSEGSLQIDRKTNPVFRGDIKLYLNSREAYASDLMSQVSAGEMKLRPDRTKFYTRRANSSCSAGTLLLETVCDPVQFAPRSLRSFAVCQSHYSPCGSCSFCLSPSCWPAQLRPRALPKHRYSERELDMYLYQHSFAVRYLTASPLLLSWHHFLPPTALRYPIVSTMSTRQCHPEIGLSLQPPACSLVCLPTVRPLKQL